MFKISAITPKGCAFSASVNDYVSVVQLYSELIEGDFREIEVLDPELCYISI